jgi:hypothetical protein
MAPRNCKQTSRRLERDRELVALPEDFDSWPPERQEEWLERFIRDAWANRPKVVKKTA